MGMKNSFRSRTSGFQEQKRPSQRWSFLFRNSLLSAGEAVERFIEERTGGFGVRCVCLPGEDAVTACPCACAAGGQNDCRCGGDAVVHHVHVAGEEHFRAAAGDVELVIEDGIEQKFRVRLTGRDLPEHLNEEVAAERCDHSLTVGAGRSRILLGADIEEGYVDGMPNAELVFAKQTREGKGRGRWVWCGRNCLRGCGDGCHRRCYCLLDLQVGVGGDRFRGAPRYENQKQAEGRKKRSFFHPKDYKGFA